MFARLPWVSFSSTGRRAPTLQPGVASPLRGRAPGLWGRRRACGSPRVDPRRPRNEGGGGKEEYKMEGGWWEPVVVLPTTSKPVGKLQDSGKWLAGNSQDRPASPCGRGRSSAPTTEARGRRETRLMGVEGAGGGGPVYRQTPSPVQLSYKTSGTSPCSRLGKSDGGWLPGCSPPHTPRAANCRAELPRPRASPPPAPRRPQPRRLQATVVATPLAVIAQGGRRVSGVSGFTESPS